VTDGAVLTHQADGALVVITLRKTTFDLLEKALDTLRKARGRPLGIVLNKAPLRGADSAAYSYEYRREYTPSKKERARDVEVPTPASAGIDVVAADAAEREDAPASGRRSDRRG
jgi:Mrp family chromosome partitioning ATPase